MRLIFSTLAVSRGIRSRSLPYHLSGFDNMLLHQCIEWDVIHYLIEGFYSEKLKVPLFFNKLISIYESGHILCGWMGHWPKGQLVILILYSSR